MSLLQTPKGTSVAEIEQVSGESIDRLNKYAGVFLGLDFYSPDYEATLGVVILALSDNFELSADEEVVELVNTTESELEDAISQYRRIMR